MRFTQFCAVLSVAAFISLPVYGDFPIAGVEPSKRPESAPTIETVKKPRGWYDLALTGIAPPLPRQFQVS